MAERRLLTIARIWSGVARTADAAEYARYIDGASRIAHYEVADHVPGGDDD